MRIDKPWIDSKRGLHSNFCDTLLLIRDLLDGGVVCRMKCPTECGWCGLGPPACGVFGPKTARSSTPF
jgi:hypothetical protein